jgi:O-methyltransferase involved in polyketide biosynthesis
VPRARPVGQQWGNNHRRESVAPSHPETSRWLGRGFYDPVVTDALDAGIDQVALVGGGYDTRAWWLADPDVRYSEVDHPSTQLAMRAHAPSGRSPSLVSADLAAVLIDESLTNAGLRTRRPRLI